MRRRVICLSAAVLWVGATSGLGAADAKRPFTLGRAVPQDCWLYCHHVYNDEREFLSQHWNEVLETVKQLRFEDDIKGLVLGGMHDEEQRAKFTQHWNRAFELIKGVKWGELLSQECVFSMRFETHESPGPMMVIPECTMLFKPSSGSLQHNVEGLVEILKELANVSEDIALSQHEAQGATIWTLGSEQFPVSLNLFQHADVVGISMTRRSAEAAIGLLAGSGGGASLVDSERFKQALGQVTPPEDAIFFVDGAKLMSSIRGVLAGVQAPLQAQHADPTHPAGARPKAGGSPAQAGSKDQTQTAGNNREQQDPAAGIQMALMLLDHLDFVDYMVQTEQTTGLQIHTHGITKVSAAGLGKPLCKIIASPKPVQNFTRYLPADAKGYWAWSGLDLEGAYGFVTGLVREHLPDGGDKLQEWEQRKTEWEFDPKQDLFSWLEGPVLVITLPPEVRTPFSTSDTVLMLKVSDAEKASSVVHKWLDPLTTAPEGQMAKLRAGPADDIKAEGFRSLSIPILAMMGMPKFIYGFYDGWLMVGSSSSAVNKCLATSQGTAPSFVDGSRFKAEGIAPAGPVAQASFSDLTTVGQECAMALQMVQLFGGLAAADSSNRGVAAAFGMVGKLGRVFAKLDFWRSSSSVCTFEGDRWVWRSVTTYKPYTAPASPQPSEKKPDESKLNGL